MINVEKTIRVLGYILYTILWSPIILLGFIVLPIVALGLGLRMGMTFNEIAAGYWRSLKTSVRHDIEFIKTGEW